MRGGGGGWRGEVRAGHRPLPPGALPGTAAGAGEGPPRRASRHPLGGSPGEAGVGPGGADSQLPRLRENEAFSSLLLPPPMRVCADGARQSPSRPRPAPASISTGGGGRSNNLPSPCWKEATSGPEREEAAAVSREAGRAEGSGRAGGTRLLPAPRPRYRWSGAAGGSEEGCTEMAATTW